MRSRRLILAFMLVFPMIIGAAILPVSDSVFGNVEEFTSGFPDLGDSEKGIQGIGDGFALSQDTKEGVLDPNSITQRGHQETDPVRARTDSGHNSQQNITIDDRPHEREPQYTTSEKNRSNN